ncbi:MAG: DNA replication/repair protein RecF [Clostridiaceae bacterium]
MLIQRLKLNDYRNYESLELHPSPGLNVIAGENAQGKTNALEAVFLCAFGRSHRTSRDAELIRRGMPGGYVGVTLTNALGTHTVEVKLRADEPKKILINGQSVKRLGELMGTLNVVLFSPGDLCIVQGGPADRRRFMDMELSQMYPTYFYRLQQYNVALKQRNALLKESPMAVKPGMLAMWDEQLATLGESIIAARCRFLDEISTVAYDLHRQISGGRERLNVCYDPNVDTEAATGVREALLERLSQSAQEDLRRGFTGVGPHRDDIAIKLEDVDLRTFGSQGQQRTAALSLKLSEIALLRDVKGEPPVLLLDDVLSELDERRQRMLLTASKGCQCFLTCTSLSGVEKAGILDMEVFTCKDGRLISA